MNIIEKFYYKSEIINLLDLDENRKYTLLFIYFKFKDLLEDVNFKKTFKAYNNLCFIKYNNLDKENKLIDYIYKNFTIKYKLYNIDRGKIVEDITI